MLKMALVLSICFTIMALFNDQSIQHYNCTGAMNSWTNAGLAVKQRISSCKVGWCRGSFPRWFYDPTLQQCKEFIFGGCKPNKNNYLREEECKLACRNVKGDMLVSVVHWRAQTWENGHLSLLALPACCAVGHPCHKSSLLIHVHRVHLDSQGYSAQLLYLFLVSTRCSRMELFCLRCGTFNSLLCLCICLCTL
uniref:BPTI/Kunitz inhibitor domain-containing protein n=1 Tax=Pavo cristatus TaxID=9049 RepID=A0A8C9LF31_PAVCR